MVVPAPPSTGSPASGFGAARLALQLFVVDRLPQWATKPVLWRRLGVEEGFAYRWHEHPVPPPAQRWVDRLEASLQSAPATATVRARSRLQARRSHRDFDLRLVNVGPGRRFNNTLQVAVAVDASLTGALATAMPWPDGADPVLEVGVKRSFSQLGELEVAASPAEARRVVEAWGPGAKGIVSVRDGVHPVHRVFNAWNRNGVAHFGDFSDATRLGVLRRRRASEWPGQQAAAILERVDVRSAFASVHLWRTADLPDANPIPDDFFDQPVDDARAALEPAWPTSMPGQHRRAAFDRLWSLRNVGFARWLVHQVDRGACTMHLAEFAQLAEGQGYDRVPLTALDDAVLRLARSGPVGVFATTVEITARDITELRDLANRFVGAHFREGAIDGLAPGTFQVCIDRPARQRQREDGPAYAPFSLDSIPIPLAAPRQFSWVDTNRVVSPGTRITNCWNSASAVVVYLNTGAPSSSLPMYPGAMFRPKIPKWLELVGAVGPTTFVDSRDELDAVARSWGAGRHGVIAAAHNAHSTHMFNVYFDGERVRFIDAHLGIEGDYNFDVEWMRIGVAEVGSLHPRFLR